MEPWHYHTTDDLEETWLKRLGRFPREPDMLVYGMRIVCAGLMRLWMRSFHRLRIEGRDHLPPGGPFIVVANHTSHLDAAAILCALPIRRVHRAFPAAARDYFFVNLPRTAVAAVVINALPFDREQNIRQSLGLCRRLLAAKSANTLILFPEGSRSPDGQLGEFLPGVSVLVAGADTPVVPCHIEGAHRAWPKGRRWPRPGRVRVRIGTPRLYADRHRDKASCERIAAELHDAVRALADGNAPDDPGAA